MSVLHSAFFRQSMIVLVISVILTWYMIGLAAFVAVLAYPQFARVGASEFAAYHKAHLDGTGWVIVPVMILELASGIVLVWQNDRATWAWASLILLALVWGLTFGRAVPLHVRLGRGYDSANLQRLGRVHLYRTVAWLARGVLLAGVVLHWG